MGIREPRLASDDLVDELSEDGAHRVVTKPGPWRVFLSHTSELREHPGPGQSYVDRAERAVIASGHTPVDMIDFASADQKPATLCEEEVRRGDVYVGIFGLRYGSPVRDRPEVSYTELEFDTATERGIPRLVFVVDTTSKTLDIPPESLLDLTHGHRQAAFLQRVNDCGLTVRRFRNPDHLQLLIERSLRKLRERSTNTQPAQPPRSRPNWTWPTPLDSAHHRAEKREGFVGRDWLFVEVRTWARSGPEQALLITADFGVGKSAFLAELVESGQETQAPGLPIAAHHFCDHATSATLAPGEFVTNVAAQLARALPAYRALLEADDAEALRSRLNDAKRDPSSAWDQAVVAPLARITPPAPLLLLVVDALDEALEHRPDTTGAPGLTIVDLLAQHTRRLPPWLRVLATSRPREEVLCPMGQAFKPRQLDAEQAANLNDIEAYARGRCRHGDLGERLAAANLRAEAVASRIRALSGGKFLYAVRVLNELAAGSLPLRGPADLAQLPAGIEAFYRNTFHRRFPPAEKEAYAPVRQLLALLCAQREPLAIGTLAAISGDLSPAEVEAALEPIDDLLRRRQLPDAEGADWTLRLDHFSLEQWLSERNERGRWRAGPYAVDRQAASKRIRAWAMAEVEADHAHHWPYLVRHLASHLTAEERPGVLAGRLGEFSWLEARLRLAGINGLLGDFAVAAASPGLGRLERALRQGAHVLSHGDGWRGHEQLASQLLARLAEDGGSPVAGRLRAQAKGWLHQAGGAAPLAASLVANDALLRTLPAGSGVSALAVLPDGRLASGSNDGTIRQWDPETGACEPCLCLASSYPQTIAITDCSCPLEGLVRRQFLSP